MLVVGDTLANERICARPWCPESDPTTSSPGTDALRKEEGEKKTPCILGGKLGGKLGDILIDKLGHNLKNV